MNNINILIVFFLLLTIIYLFFQTLMNKVDNKLKNLNLKVESQPVKLEFPDEFNKYIIQSSKYNNMTGEKDDNIEVDKSIVNNIDTPSESFIESFDQYQNKNKVFENKQKSSHMCFVNHKHANCNLGAMNYSDPKDLNDMDYKLFKLNYPPNMAL